MANLNEQPRYDEALDAVREEIMFATDALPVDSGEGSWVHNLAVEIIKSLDGSDLLNLKED